jgi:hypothetical protein
MSLLAPLALAFGALAAAVVVGLHLLTTRRPPAMLLPTARFVPHADARAVARTSRPTDLLLLALRALAVLLVGAAFARPVPDAPGARVRTVVLLDISSGLADRAAAIDSARLRLTEGGVLVVFDTAARVIPADSLDEVMRGGSDASFAAPGPLSPALAAARTAAGRVARGADSVRLVIVSPLTASAFDAATRSLRDAWPAGAELVRVPATADTARAPATRLVTARADDPLAPALARLPAERGAHLVRIVRSPPSVDDSTWAREPSRVLVVWPVGDATLAPDGVTSTGARPATLVAPLARFPVPADERVVARWRDGTPAVVESALGAGCMRSVGVGIPLAGDLTLRDPFARFLAALVEPCGGARGVALPDSAVAWLAGNGEAAPATLLAQASAADWRLGAWLLALALLLLAGEWMLRRRTAA